MNSIDEKATLGDLYKADFERFRKTESDLRAIIPELELSSMQIKPHDSFLYIENAAPSPQKGYNELRCFSKSDYQIESNSHASSIPIELPKENDELNLEHLTIPSLNNYFQFYIKTIRLFPNFVSSMLSKGSKEMENEAIVCFMKLLQIYNDLPEKDFSLISSTTNLYCDSFVSMVGKLKKAGVNFGKILPEKCKISNEVIQDFFQYPEKDNFYLPPNEWLSSYKYSANRVFDIPLASNQYDIDVNDNVNNYIPPVPPSSKEYGNDTDSHQDKPESNDEKLNEDDIKKLDVEFKKLIDDV